MLSMSKKELQDFFSVHPIAKTKLADELELYMSGETNVDKYNEKNITWWVKNS